MKEVYEECPILENDKYLLRLVQMGDAKALIKVYSDEKAVPYFNSDNCHGDNFFYKTIERMQQTIKCWLMEYGRKGYVRWSIIDKLSNEVVGTIELFNRKSKDYFNACGLLRLDLRSDYENEKCILKILSIIIKDAYELFNCNMIATKAIPLAEERIKALKHIGFRESEEKVVGHDGTEYGDYWVLLKS